MLRPADVTAHLKVEYMILEEKEVLARLESPGNLLNRLKSLTNKHKPTHPALPPTAEDVVSDLEEKLAFGTIKSKAASIMVQALDELKVRIPEVQRPENLSRIASDMEKIVTAQTENSRSDRSNTQFVIYSPTVINEEHFDTIYARD